MLIRLTRRALPVGARRAILQRLPDGLWDRVRPLADRQPITLRLLRRCLIWAYRLRRARLLAADPRLRVVWANRRPEVGAVITQLSVTRVMKQNLALVADALERADVPYFLMTPRNQARRHVIGVPEENRSQTLRALDTCRGQPVYVGLVRDGNVRRRRMIGGLAGRLALRRAPVLRVYRSHALGQHLVLGDLYGCDVEFWREDTDDLLAPRRNGVTEILPEEQRRRTFVDVRGRDYSTAVPFTERPFDHVDFPVDVVYTWVDGSDPAWRARKDACLAERGMAALNAQAANEARYRSQDELRFSLRSLDMFADWVRTVYLVTDDQVPPWLDLTHPKIRIVSHRELFGDTGRLPTFNSHAIESRLHRIPGLAEHYLYLNDDVFFGRPIAPELFFHSNGLTKFFLSKAHIEIGTSTVDDPPVTSAGKNNRTLIEKTFERFVTQKFKHVAHPQRKSVVEEMERRYPDEFARTATSQFRHPDDISIAASLYHYYAYFTGRAVPGHIRYTYTDLSDPKTPYRLRRLLRLRNLDVFCLNDTVDGEVGHDEQMHLIFEFLTAYYPLKSSFER